MTVAELITLLENRLDNNGRERAAAFARGDAGMVAHLDADIASTTASLTALRSLGA